MRRLLSVCSSAHRRPSSPARFDLTIDYERFGVPVDVEAPAGDEMADAVELSGG
jgi:hypothetical protein